ncbi:MAG TPA: hypothetical protein VK470_01645, partial [Bacteroidota bacterium]|nr:hypothetical protein [Bacteroidota bacterium]
MSSLTQRIVQYNHRRVGYGNHDHVAAPGHGDLFAALARALDRMEDRLLHLGTSGPKTAVFDLDNTLLLGDIGDAVFV